MVADKAGAGSTGYYRVSDSDRETLRRLAGRWMELASLPVMAERRRLWTALNDLHAERPMVLFETALSGGLRRRRRTGLPGPLPARCGAAHALDDPPRRRGGRRPGGGAVLARLLGDRALRLRRGDPLRQCGGYAGRPRGLCVPASHSHPRRCGAIAPAHLSRAPHQDSPAGRAVAGLFRRCPARGAARHGPLSLRPDPGPVQADQQRQLAHLVIRCAGGLACGDGCPARRPPGLL